MLIYMNKCIRTAGNNQNGMLDRFRFASLYKTSNVVFLDVYSCKEDQMKKQLRDV